MGFRKWQEVQARKGQAGAKPAVSKDRTFGFAEELSADIAMEKLLGHNFLDDGKLLEADGEDPTEKLRARLIAMDGLAMEMRKSLNNLVKEGIGAVEEAQYVDLGEGTGVVDSMKPVLTRLLTAYTELVSKLQAAREMVGYEVEGPSVTQDASQEAVQEKQMKRYGASFVEGHTNKGRV